MDVDDPIALAEERFRSLAAGEEPDITADATARALAEARATRSERMHRGVSDSGSSTRRRSDGGDHQEFVLVLTDGTRDAAIVAQLSGTAAPRHRGTAAAVIAGRGEDPATHLLERMRRAVGTLPNDGHRYENVILNHRRCTRRKPPGVRDA